jgi:hypothetical protein
MEVVGAPEKMTEPSAGAVHFFGTFPLFTRH